MWATKAYGVHLLHYPLLHGGVNLLKHPRPPNLRGLHKHTKSINRTPLLIRRMSSTQGVRRRRRPWRRRGSSRRSCRIRRRRSRGRTGRRPSRRAGASPPLIPSSPLLLRAAERTERSRGGPALEARWSGSPSCRRPVKPPPPSPGG